MAMRAISETGSRGFTLLELLVVLTIIVLIAASWPLASSRVFTTQRLRNETQRLAATIRAAQVTARFTGKPQYLSISQQGNSYQTAAAAWELPEGLSLRILAGSADTTDERIQFSPDGSSSGGLLELAMHDHTASIRVLPATGRMELNP